MNTYKLGIIGYGGFGKFLHNSWKKLKSISIAAVADIEASGKPPDKILYYNQWKDLINNEYIDIVAIATPPATHTEIACAAMTVGKHVFIEKPLATTIEDAKRIIAVRDKSKTKPTDDFMMRFHPIIKTINVFSHEKVFGELRRIDVENYAQDSSLPSDHWFWDHNVSGGILIEHGAHFFDLVNSLTDQHYKKVTGFCSSHNIKQENQVLADVLYNDGLIATHYHSFARPAFFEHTSIRFNYDLAQIDIEGWIPLSGQIKALVNFDTEKKLQQLPNFHFKQKLPIEQVEDVSRSHGWGVESRQNEQLTHNIVRSGGIEYNVEKMIVGTFNIRRSKTEIYAECLCAILEDFMMSIENPAHNHLVELEDGLLSLEIAVLAAKFRRKIVL